MACINIVDRRLDPEELLEKEMITVLAFFFNAELKVILTFNRNSI
jgi:hypothetical protein